MDEEEKTRINPEDENDDEDDDHDVDDIDHTKLPKETLQNKDLLEWEVDLEGFLECFRLVQWS